MQVAFLVSSFNIRCLPTTVPHNIITRSVLWEEARDASLISLTAKSSKAPELEKAEIKKIEDAVQGTMTAISNFTNSFSRVDKDHIYSFAAGAPASSGIEYDVIRAEKAGKKAKDTFI